LGGLRKQAPQRSTAEQTSQCGDQRCDGRNDKRAIESLRKAVRVAPDYGDLALLLQRKNQCAEAADYWRRYLAIDGLSEWASRARRSLKFCEMQQHLIV